MMYVSWCDSRSTPSPTASPSPIHVSSVATKSPIHLSTRRPMQKQKQMATPGPNMIPGSTVAKMPRHQVRQELGFVFIICIHKARFIFVLYSPSLHSREIKSALYSLSYEIFTQSCFVANLLDGPGRKIEILLAIFTVPVGCASKTTKSRKAFGA